MTIDTRMNGIIHAALRRDLDRTAMVLDGTEEVWTTSSRRCNLPRLSRVLVP